MSELLDDLARTLAQPMSRRRAVGVVGVTLVGLATGGTAGAGRPLGTRQSECGAAYKVCEPASQRCRVHCCPKHTVCSFSKRSETTGCQILPGCCDPCNPRASTPNGNGGCVPGPVAGHCPCKPGQKVCWRGGGGQAAVCCDQDEYCVSSLKEEGQGNLSICCKRGQRSCPTGSGFKCCPQGTRCCAKRTESGLRSSCCNPLTQTCDGGDCNCKPGHTVKCGKDCCHPRLHKCCGKRCVPKGTDCEELPNT